MKLISKEYQLLSVLGPLFELYSHTYPSTETEVYEIVQVAELRRMALGSRFIGWSHLIWAFYECGYGLPSVLGEQIKFSRLIGNHKHSQDKLSKLESTYFAENTSSINQDFG